MIHNLIPVFIQERFARGEQTGRLHAATLFVDVSGFTALTEALMCAGDEGAEVMSTILNRTFSPLVETVAAYNGFIAEFVGDAFMAVFEDIPQRDSSEAGRVLSQALACATYIQDHFCKHGVQQTRFGRFELSARVGVAYGDVHWGIAGGTEKTYFFRGPAIDAGVHAQHHALPGEVVVSIAGMPENLSVWQLEPLECASLARVVTAPVSPALFALESPIPPPETLLRRFLPDAVVDFDRTGEFRNVAALFIAFSGVETPAALDAFVSVLIENAVRFSVYLSRVGFGDKGNVALCLFGAPVSFEDNVACALDFILAIRQDFCCHPELLDLSWHAGLSYGLVYAGLIGGLRRCEYTVIGDQVNLSARIMTESTPGEVWVSDTIYRRAEQMYEFTPLGKFAFKGKSGHIPIYRFEGKKHLVKRNFTGAFVGRSSELTQVTAALDKLTGGQFSGVLYIYGEAGVGKSRLVYEARRAYSHLQWLYLPCDSILKKPFNPFMHFFSYFFKQSAENTLLQNRENFMAVYRMLLDETATEEMAANHMELLRLRSVMAGFMGIHEDDSLYTQLEPRLRYQNTLYVFQEIFRVLAQRAPLVLEVEDLQWIDDDSAKALKTICHGLSEMPLLLVITSRYDAEHNPAALSFDAATVPTTAIDLGKLSPTGVRDLTVALLAGSPSPRLLTYLQSKTQGNPFFLEQTVRYFQESGIITKVDSASGPVWELQRDKSAIPATINDLLIARIDRLASKLKAVIQTAAVLGQEFQVILLTEVLRQASRGILPDDVSIYLQRGVDEHIWTVLSELSYVFSHAMLRDVAYQMQLRNRLRDLHRVAAEAIARLYPDDRRTYADLAFHYERAEMYKLAITYLRQAGDFAADTYAAAVAAEHYRRALSLFDKLSLSQEDTLTQRIELYRLLGKMLRWQAQYDEATHAFSTMRQLAEVSRNIVAQAQAWNEISMLQDRQGDYAAARTSARQATDIARTAGEQNVLAQSLRMQGWIAYRVGDIEAALTYGEEALTLCAHNRLKVRVLNTIASAYSSRGQCQNAIDYYQQALAISRELGDRRSEGVILGNLSDAALQQGEYAEALRLADSAVAITREVGHRWLERIYLANRGGAQVGLGNFVTGEEDLQQSLALSRRLGARRVFAETYYFLAEALLGQGRFSEAYAAALQALELAREDARDLGRAWRVLACIAAQTGESQLVKGDFYDAESCFAKSLAFLAGPYLETEHARTRQACAVWKIVIEDHGGEP